MAKLAGEEIADPLRPEIELLTRQYSTPESIAKLSPEEAGAVAAKISEDDILNKRVESMYFRLMERYGDSLITINTPEDLFKYGILKTVKDSSGKEVIVTDFVLRGTNLGLLGLEKEKEDFKIRWSRSPGYFNTAGLSWGSAISYACSRNGVDWVRTPEAIAISKSQTANILLAVDRNDVIHELPPPGIDDWQVYFPADRMPSIPKVKVYRVSPNLKMHHLFVYAVTHKLKNETGMSSGQPKLNSSEN